MNRIFSAFCAVLLLLGLAACNEEPKPRFEPRESSETPTSPTTSTTTDPPEPEGLVEPEMPALASKHTKKGAEAFAVHYWEMAEYSLLTGDTKPLKALGTDGCKTCERGTRDIDHIYARGGEVIGGETREAPHGIKPLVVGSSRGYVVDLTISNTKQTITFPNGKGNAKYGASSVKLEFFIKQVPSGYLAAYWERA